MAFKVSMQKSPPQMDSLPVAKIIRYPLEQRDYRPYAQNRICITPEGLVVQMWAFEVSPQEDSALQAVFNLFPDESGIYLNITAYSTGKVEVGLLENGEAKPLPDCAQWEITPRPFGGEDLQGVYWGNVITLSNHHIEAIYSRSALEKGDKLRGNFYKVSTCSPCPHYGSFYPAAFPNDPYGPDSMGDFEVVDY